MNMRTLIVALLLSATVGTTASAAETPEQESKLQSKNARKVLAVLGSVGINDPQVKSFIGDVDNYIKDGYLTFDERKIAGGTLVLHFEVSKSVTSKQLELRYTPDDSGWVATARPGEYRVQYSYKF